MSDDLTWQIEQTLEQIGINPRIDWRKRINVSDVLYLLDRCPFLQMVDGGSAPQSTEKLNIITGKSGWKIHDYKDAMSSSPGLLLFGGGNFKIRLPEEEDEGGEGGGIINPGKGTIINQSVVTAFEMVELAQLYGWAKIKLIDGHPLMMWAAWMQALDAGIEISGFEPSEHDYGKRRRIKRSRSEEQTMLYRPPTP